MSTTKLALSFRMFKHGQLIREDTLTQAVIKVGKVPSAHLRIDDESVSRMHAVIEVSQHEVSLIDLGSTRGTFVNGKKINKARLASGDVITIGDVVVELAIAQAEPVRRPPVEAAAAPAAPEARRPPVSTLPSVPPPVPPPVPPSMPPPVIVRSAPATPPVPPPAIARSAPVTPTVPVRAVARPIARPIEVAAHPVASPQVVAGPADELGGAGAVEVAAMLGDSVIGVKHCMDPRSGKVTPATWGLFAGCVACLLASAIAFVASVRNEADNAVRLAAWTHVQHKPAHAFRPHQLGAGIDWLAFGSLAFGMTSLMLGLVRMRRERTSPYYRIGTAPGVELAIEAPLPAFPLVAPSGDDFVFNYGAGIDGELIAGGTSTPLGELAAAGRSRPSAAIAGAIEVPIPPRARIRARAGQTTFVVSAVARPRRYATPFLAQLERRALSYGAGSLAVHLGIWAFLQTIPPEAAAASVDLPQSEDPTMLVRNGAHDDSPPDKPEDTGQDGASGQNTEQTQMKLPSGAAGNPNAAKADGHMTIARRADEPRLSNAELRERMAREGILGSEGLASAITVLGAQGSFASGFDLTDNNGPLYGADGEGRGNFGGGITSTDLGGGCVQGPCGTIGTRPGYGKIGIGLPPGGYGFPTRGLPGGRRNPAVPDVGPPVISKPTYDKSIVRRYIRRHLNEIGYCYEKQLLAHPSLGGDVKVTFLISPTGTVQSSSGTGFDNEVASCLASVVKTIEFPPPGDEGVQVNYPFHFHAPGQ